jgi:hypothetical protein
VDASRATARPVRGTAAGTAPGQAASDAAAASKEASNTGAAAKGAAGTAGKGTESRGTAAPGRATAGTGAAGTAKATASPGATATGPAQPLPLKPSLAPTYAAAPAPALDPRGPSSTTVVDAKSRFLREVHATACRRFMTTLGPEADLAHRNHFHVDLAERRSDYRICQ